MRDICILLSFLAFAAFGYVLMGKLDRALAQARHEPAACDQPCFIRIAFSNPFAADSIYTALELIADDYPNAKFSLFSGGDDEVLQRFGSGQADVAVVSTLASTDASWNVSPARFSLRPLFRKGCSCLAGTSISPDLEQKVLWRQSACSPATLELIHRLSSQRQFGFSR